MNCLECAPRRGTHSLFVSLFLPKDLGDSQLESTTALVRYALLVRPKKGRFFNANPLKGTWIRDIFYPQAPKLLQLLLLRTTLQP